jgi:hypothetical protein
LQQGEIILSPRKNKPNISPLIFVKFLLAVMAKICANDFKGLAKNDFDQQWESYYWISLIGL